MLATLWALFLVALVVAPTTQAQESGQDVHTLIKSGQFKSATEILNRQIAADPSYFENYYLLGRVLYEQELYEQAKEKFETALERKSRHYESIYFLGRCELALGNLDAAEEQFQAGLKRAKDIKAWFENGMALVHIAREEYTEADVALRRAMALTEEKIEKVQNDMKRAPGDADEKQRYVDSVTSKLNQEMAEYYINLGLMYVEQGVPALATSNFEKALEIDTASVEVYFQWAEACLAMRDYQCASDKLKLVLQKDSSYAPAWNRAGGIYYLAARSTRERDARRQRFMDAIGSYRKYFELTNATPDSSNVRAYFEIAMSYENIYGFEDAVPYYENVLSIPVEPKDIYFYYAKALLLGKRDYDKAAEMLKKHKEWVDAQGEEFTSSVDDWEYYQLLGDAYFYKKPKDFYSAIPNYVQSIELRPDQKRILQNLAIAYHSTRQYFDALKYYDLRIEQGLDSNSVSVLKNAGLAALSLAGSADEEEEEMLDEEEMIDITPVSAPDPNVNYHEVAVDYMKQYLETVPNDTTVVLRIANTYLYQLEDCANGVSYFERLLTLSPDNCVAKKSLGFAYFGGICDKNYSKALPYLIDAHRCMSKDGECSDVALTRWIAQCYHLRAAGKTEGASDDYEKAADWYRKVLKCDPNDKESEKALNDIIYEF